jgi:hypothetical protein
MHCGAEVTESSTNKQHHHHCGGIWECRRLVFGPFCEFWAFISYLFPKSYVKVMAKQQPIANNNKNSTFCSLN